jgi:hypothetical protein
MAELFSTDLVELMDDRKLALDFQCDALSTCVVGVTSATRPWLSRKALRSMLVALMRISAFLPAVTLTSPCRYPRSIAPLWRKRLDDPLESRYRVK